MFHHKLLHVLAFAALLSGFYGCFSSTRTGKPKEPTVYALVWLGESIRPLPNGEGKDRAEVFRSRANRFRDEMDVLQPALQDPAVAKFRGFWRDEEWLKKNLRVELLKEPEALRPVLARGQGVARVWLADGSPEEQAAFVNAVVRAWDNAFYARQRGNGAEEDLKAMQKREIECVRDQEARLAVLNRKPIPDDPRKRKSLEGQKRVTADSIRRSQKAIERFPKLIEEDRAAQLKIPIVLEWAKVP